MNFKTFYPYILFIPVAFIQVTFASMLSFDNITPDFVVILLVLFTLKRGQFNGTVLGFSYGLLFDLISGGLIGSAAFSKTVSGFIAGYFYNEHEEEENTLVKTSLIILLCSSVDSLLYTILGAAEIIDLGTLFLFQSILSAVFTMAISIPILIIKPERFLL